MAALSGNAWSGGKGKAAGGGDRGATQPAPVQAEQHVPVRDFNAAEVKAYLKNSMSIYFYVADTSICAYAAYSCHHNLGEQANRS